MDPNAYGPRNPDTRTLPYGFVQRFDTNYQTWYYVNALANPPVPSWRHPVDEFPNEPGYSQQGYSGQPHYDQGYPSGHGSGHGGYESHDDHKKSKGGGLGTGAAVGLGVGAGVIGGLVVADAIQDVQEDAYQEGFEAGGGDESD